MTITGYIMIVENVPRLTANIARWTWDMAYEGRKEYEPSRAESKLRQSVEDVNTFLMGDAMPKLSVNCDDLQYALEISRNLLRNEFQARLSSL